MADESEDLVYLRKVAILEVNLLLAEQLIPGDFEGMRLEANEEMIFSMEGQIVMHQLHLTDSIGRSSGFVEYAVDPIFGGVLLAVGLGNGTYMADGLTDIRAKGERGGSGRSEADLLKSAGSGELVVYSYPKLGVRGSGGELRDLYTGEIVVEGEGGDELDVGEAQNLTSDLSPNEVVRRRDLFVAEKEFWRGIIESAPTSISWDVVSRRWFQGLVSGKLSIGTRNIYKVSDSSEAPDQGIQLVGQDYRSWCFGACLQALFSYYRYSYPQAVLAFVLGLGDRGADRSLPRSAEHDVVVAIEKMSGGALTGKMIRTPEWRDFSDEIEAARPAIGLINGHCRLVIGASAIDMTFNSGSVASRLGLKGLTLLDPWPARKGTMICWENWGAIPYLALFEAHLDLVSAESVGFSDYLVYKANEVVKNNALKWGLSEGAQVSELETLDLRGRSSGWLASVAEGGKVIGFVRFKKDLSFGGFHRRKDGGPFLDRRSAEKELLKKADKRERVQKVRLTFDNSNAIVWTATAKKPDADRREIRLDDSKIPTELIS